MRILCATDNLPRSAVAVERATLLRDQLAADLALLHVVPGAAGRLQPLLWQRERVPEVTVRAGDPARVIVEAIERSKAKLLVLGQHPKRSLREIFEGTIADTAVDAKHCPVLLVQSRISGRYRRVLLALDLSDASATALRAAEALVLDRDAQARVVHVHAPPYQGMLHYADAGMGRALRYPAGSELAAEQGILDLLRYEGTQCARYDVRVEQEPVVPAILDSVERYEPDLLVMGTQAGGWLRRALFRSVADRVLHEAGCDVLIVPEGSFGTLRSRLFLGVRFPLGRGRESWVTGTQ